MASEIQQSEVISKCTKCRRPQKISKEIIGSLVSDSTHQTVKGATVMIWLCNSILKSLWCKFDHFVFAVFFKMNLEFPWRVCQSLLSWLSSSLALVWSLVSYPQSHSDIKSWCSCVYCQQDKLEKDKNQDHPHHSPPHPAHRNGTSWEVRQRTFVHLFGCSLLLLLPLLCSICYPQNELIIFIFIFGNRDKNL